MICAPTKHTTEFPVHVESSGPITAVKLEVLNDPNLPCGGPGRLRERPRERLPGRADG